MRRLCLLTAIGATAILVACSSEDPFYPSAHQSLSLGARLIQDEPREAFSTDLLLHKDLVFEWRFDHPAERQAWEKLHAGPWEPLTDGGAALPAEGKLRPTLRRQVELDPRQIDAVEIDQLRFAGGDTSIAWAESGEEGGEERRIVLPAGRRGGGFATYSFRLRGSPGWDEARRIETLEVVPGIKGGRSAIREVRGIRYRVDEDALARAVEKPFRVDLGSEVRDARLAPPGLPIPWSVQVAKGSQLDFSYGISPALRHPIRFVVKLREPGSAILFDTVLDGRNPAHAGWHEQSVDLTSLDAGEHLLVFETELVPSEPSSEVPSPGAFPFWGHPAVLTPQRTERRPTSRPPNLVLISLDTLRGDHLSTAGYERETSPNLAAWARRAAIRFDQAISPAPSTLPSHASFLTGLSPFATGVNHHGRIPDDVTLLASHLRKAGFSTRAVTGGAYLHPSYGFDRGFEVYRYWSDRRNAEEELARGVEGVSRWLRSEMASPFFLFFHTYEVHTPLRSRQPFVGLFGAPERAGSGSYVTFHTNDDGRKEPVFKRPGEAHQKISDDELEAYYDAGIAYTDELLRRLFKLLEEPEIARNTVVVVTSDHGEALGEGGLYGHSLLHDSNLVVPLLVALPSGEHAGREVTEQVSLIDLVPTLLDLLQLPVPAGLDGRSMLPLLDGAERSASREAWSYHPPAGVSLRIANRLKYVLHSSAWATTRPREEVYDLVRDPGEARNLVASAPEVDVLRHRARQLLEKSHRGIRARFDNRGPRLFEGSLEGSLLLPDGAISSPNMPCACLERTGLDRAGLRVPPKTRIDLYFELVQPEHLEISGRLGDSDLLDEEVDLRLIESWGRASDGRSWTSDTPSTEDTGMTITLWWEGGRPPEDDAPASTPDAALVERLRALGYLG